MKRIFTLFFVLFLPTVLLSQESPWEKKLPYKNLTIKYKIDGTVTGHKYLYIKDYGRTTTEYKETTLNLFGIIKKEKELIITTTDWEYRVDLLTNTGTKQLNMDKLLTLEFHKLSNKDKDKVAKKANKLGINILESSNGKIEKNAKTILGYKCDKSNMMGTAVYVMSDTQIPLEIKSNMMGIQMSEIATKISKKSIPDKRFKIPNIEYKHSKESDKMMKRQAKNIINNLLKDTKPKEKKEDLSKDYDMDWEENKNEPEQQQNNDKEQLNQFLNMFKNK